MEKGKEYYYSNYIKFEGEFLNGKRKKGNNYIQLNIQFFILFLKQIN